MSALLELAERCEKANGPDRELDADISLVIGITARERRSFDGWNAMRGRGEAPRLERDWLLKNGRRWTASLDAAMTLVPEGFRVLIDNDGCHCRLTDPRGDDDASPWNRVNGFAGTVALAACAAALRARCTRP